MKLLRLANTVNPTSAPYNQFSLGLKDSIDQTFCSLFRNEIEFDDDITGCNANGSVFKMIKLVRKLISKNKYDLIHIHSGLTGLIFFIALIPIRISLINKTVFTLHNSWNVLKFRNQLLNFFVMLLAKKICTCGQSSLDSIPWAIKLCIGHKTIAVVNGFDNYRVDRVERDSNKDHYFENSGLKIVCVGALNPTKNQIALLKALESYSIDGEIIFLGDGTKKQALIDFADTLNNPCKITFKGRVSRDIAIEHMLQADISISLSRGEGLPIAVLESMYAGCFLILSNIPPHKEIAPPSGRCIYVDNSNIDNIIEALDYVGKYVEQIREERHISKRYSIKNFSVNKMLAEYRKVYDFI